MAHFFVDPDISVAKTISTEFYTNPEYFERSKEKIFAPSWQFIGDTSLVPEQGSCHPFCLLPDFIHEPLLLTRNREDRLFCLPNVCTHRGNLLIQEGCKSAHIRCRYHGRIFDLDGTFRSMPEFREVKDFPSADDHLKQLDWYIWGNLLFTSLSNQYHPTAFFKEMMERVEWLPLGEFRFRPELSKEYMVNAHWALYCENYLEGFHIPYVHAGLNAVIDYGNYTTELFSHSNLQVGMAKDEEDCFDIPIQSPDHGKKIAAYYFWIFPNMMFNFYPWGLSINIVEPVTTQKTRVRFLTYVWKDNLFNTGAGSDLNTVELEDEEVVEAVQSGIRSRYYTHGRYSVTREQGTHHFHRLLCSFLD